MLVALSGYDTSRYVEQSTPRAKHIPLKKPGPKPVAAPRTEIRTVRLQRMQDVITAAELLCAAATPHNGSQAIVPRDELIMLDYCLRAFKAVGR